MHQMKNAGRCLAWFLIVVSCSTLSTWAAEPSAAAEDNWHQWRGPTANGVAIRGNPPLRWSETENIAWKTELPGHGASTPIVWGDQVFILAAVKTDRESDLDPVPRSVEQPDEVAGRPIRLPPAPTRYYRFLVISVDKHSGKILWQRTATERVPHRGHHPHHGYASGSPTTDGRLLFASFGSYGTYCFDLEGNLRWSRDLGRMETYADFGEAVTPVICQGSLIVVHDQMDQSFIVALDAETGKTKWRVERDELAGWSTPLIVEHNDVTQVVVNGRGRTRSYDLETGQIIWQCGGQSDAIVPCPVAADGLVYCMSGYPQQRLLAISLDSSGDVTDTDRVAWRLDRDTSYVPSPVLLDGVLYFLKINNTILTAVDAKTGRPVIETQRLPDLPGNIYASPVSAAGHVYFTARNGTTLVIKHGAKVEPVAVNRLDDPIDASAVIVGDRLFLRGQNYLYCIRRQDGS
jgi:outer membrane protein assembly factor BamB